MSAVYAFDLLLTDFGSDNCNIELFKEELRDAFLTPGYTLEAVNEIETGIRVLTPDYGSPTVYDAIETLVNSTASSHDHTLKTEWQLIDIQESSAKSDARDELYDLRDQTPTAMYAIWLARKYAELEGDSVTINTQGQAASYVEGKIKDIHDDIYAGNTTASSASEANYEQAKFKWGVLISEYKSNGSDTS